MDESPDTVARLLREGVIDLNKLYGVKENEEENAEQKPEEKKPEEKKPEEAKPEEAKPEGPKPETSGSEGK